MIIAGIDCGAKNTKTVILKAGKILGRALVPTAFEPARAIDESLAGAIAAAGISRGEIACTAGTASGKIAVDIANESVNEFRAMARSARFYYPSAGTVVDIGAEQGRAVKIDEAGEPVDFAQNDKCAAGAGAFIDAMARALEVSLEEMGSMSLESRRKILLNAQCTVFAESEVVGLIHSQTEKPDISRAIHEAIAGRTVSMMRRCGVNEDVVLIGGVARNRGFLAALQRELKLDMLYVPTAPEFGVAVGAALVAAEKLGSEADGPAV